MAGNCSKCGSLLKEGARFCENCGAPVEANVQPAAANLNAAYAAVPSPGYSERVNDPEILAAVKKNKRAAAVFAFILVPLPLIGFMIYSFVSDKMETADAVKYGAIISAVFLVFALYALIKSKTEKSYDGIVTEQRSKLRTVTDNDNSTETTYTEYITYVKTSDGKKKKIKETDRGLVTAYHYLNEGDRFMYHPQFNFPYEHYDKTKAPYIGCVSCGTHNPLTADRCSKCNLPLLK